MLTVKMNAANASTWRALMTDEISVKILSSLVKMSDLAECGVSGACGDGGEARARR